MMNKLHGIIFAYLSNPDLRELTQHRNTCSIPYGGQYRVIDFMLSNMVNAGVTSPYTLYDEQTASFGEDDDYNQADASGFINLFGLPIAERAKLAKSWPAQD